MAVTFDAVGTLIEPREPVGQTYARIARQHGVRLNPELLEARFREAYGNAPPLCFPDLGEEAVSHLEQEWWREVVRAVFSGVPWATVDRIFADLFRFYGGGEAWRVFSDVVPTLSELERRGIRRCVVSNFDARLFRVCADLGLAPRFDAIVVSSRAGAAKPAPEIFFRALAPLRVRPEQAVHVGDSWREDVLGAQAAGMRALWIDRSQPPTSGRIHSLETVLACFDVQ